MKFFWVLKSYTMLSRNEVKYIQSLYHKKKRNEEGVFVAEGVKLISELLNSGFGSSKFMR